MTKQAITYPDGKFERLINQVIRKELLALLDGEVTTSITGTHGASAYFSLRLSSSIITDDCQAKGDADGTIEFRLSDHENGRWHEGHINIIDRESIAKGDYKKLRQYILDEYLGN